MFRKMSLALIVLTTIACEKNVKVVSYVVDGKENKVMSKEVVEDFRTLFDGVNPQQMMFILGDSEMLKYVVQNRTFESELIVAEAMKITNFMDTEGYKDTLSGSSNKIVAALASSNALEMLSKQVEKQDVEIAEISRMMFTNAVLADGQTPESILETLLLMQDDGERMTEFTLLAEKFSQETLGVQTGGYLGQVIRGQFKTLDNIVFDEKFDGLYPEVLTDVHGSYLVYIHTPAHKVKVADFDEKGIHIMPNQIITNTVSEGTEYLYVQNENGITLNGTEMSFEDVSDDDVLVKLWGKPLTFGDVKLFVAASSGKSILDRLTTKELFLAMTPMGTDSISPLVYQLALIEKGNTSALQKSKEYKTEIAKVDSTISSSIAYQIIADSLFENVSTNVTDAELRTFYSDENNRRVVAYGEDGTPEYQSFEESKEELREMIVGNRREPIQQAFLAKLQADYEIVWDEDNFAYLSESIQSEYDKHMEEMTKLMEEQYGSDLPLAE